jgi:Tfp pilus assembly protein PilF
LEKLKKLPMVIHLSLKLKRLKWIMSFRAKTWFSYKNLLLFSDKVAGSTFLAGKRPYILISLISFTVYLRSLFFGFTYFDDNVLILDNLFFLRNISNFFRSFTTEVFHILHSSAAYYRPMLTISYMLDAQISGEGPFMYHFTSILIHIIVSNLLFVFLKKLKISESLAFIFALVFAVHPVLAQAVSWVPGRNDSLLALFALLCFIYLINYYQEESFKNYFFYLLFFTFCLFTKESAVLIPILSLFLGIIVVKKKALFSAFSSLFIGWFFIGVVWFFLRSIALSGNPLEYGSQGAVKSVFDNLSAVFLYLGKAVFPVNLSVLPTLQDSTLVYGYIASFLTVLALILSKKKNCLMIAFGTFWFFAFLLPAFIRPNLSYVAYFLEHRVYLSIVGLFIVFSEITFLKKADLNSKATALAVFLLVSILSAVNFFHNTSFKDRLTFWKQAVLTSPSHPLAHKNLGAMYYLDGRFDEAESEFKKSAAINPTEPMIHNNLGLIYFKKGDYASAEAEYKKELEYYPSYDNALSNLGLLYYQKGEKDKAAAYWLETIKVNPDHKEALRALAVYYLNDAKDNDKAQYYHTEAVKRGANF